MHYCGCDLILHSVVAVSDEDAVPVISDSSSWASLYRPIAPPIVDPNDAPTEVAPSTPALEEGETPSVPETPRLEPDKGALPPMDEAKGEAVRIEGKDVMTQTPPLLSRLIQGYLDHTGIEECPFHQMDHGVEALAVFERDLIIHFQQISRAAALYVRALLGGVKRTLEVYRRVDDTTIHGQRRPRKKGGTHMPKVRLWLHYPH